MTKSEKIRKRYKALALCETWAAERVRYHDDMLYLKSDFAKQERRRFHSWSDEKWFEYHNRELKKAATAKSWLFIEQMKIDPD